MLALGYDIGSVVYDAEQNVNLIMCTAANMPDVEIVLPGTGPGPIDNIVQRQDGQIYHMCYTTANAAESIAAIEAAGNRAICVAPQEPAILFDGKLVSFYMIPGVGVIELIESAV